MALSTEIEAKSPEAMTPREMELPSMEPVPAPGGAAGLLGLLSRPVFTVQVSAAALLLGAVAVLLTPAAFPPHAWRLPPPLPPRAPARRPRHLPSAPLPRWMATQAHLSGRSAAAGRSVTNTHRVRSGAGAAVFAGSARASRKPNASPHPISMHPLRGYPSGHQGLAGPLRIHEPAGETCVVAPTGVIMAGKRVPPEWAG